MSRQQNERPSLPPVPGPTRPALERRQFAHFVHYGAFALGGSLDSELFAGLLPAIASEDDMIWNALLVLGSLIEHPMPLNKLPIEIGNEALVLDDEHHRNALRWYSRALSKAKTLCPSDVPPEVEATLNNLDGRLLSKALLSCMLFGAIEKALGNAKNSLTLAQRAFELVGLRMTISIESSIPEIESAILPVLLKLSLPLAIFGHRVTEPLRRAAIAYRRSLDKGAVISRLKELRFDLLEIAYETQILVQDSSGQEHASYADRQAHLLALLDDWWLEYQHTTQRQESKAEYKTEILALCLRMLYKTFRVQLQCCFDESKMLVDSFKDDFSQIISDAETLTLLTRQTRESAGGYLPFEVGALYCVHFVAWECRHPSLRRRALYLLRQASVARESFWSSNVTLKIIERVMALEEGIDDVFQSQPGWEEALPPEHQRVHVHSCSDMTILQVGPTQSVPQMAPQEARPIWRPHTDGSTSLVLLTCREQVQDGFKVLKIEEYPISQWTA